MSGGQSVQWADLTSETLEPELLDVGGGTLPARRVVVVLDQVYDILYREHAGKLGRRRVPQWRGDDAWR